jgi:mannitol/fructose-specific phosphotransferase system IIA component (Ntr-type)
VPGKAKAGIVRDMSDLAARTGLVYDPEGLFKELLAREEIASTAVGEGAAFLHPRFHDPYFFEESFIAYGRSLRPVFFGAPNGEGTRHFFLVCAADHVLHLNILSRLAVMAHATEFLAILDEAADVGEALSIIRAAEEGLLR